MFLNLTLNSKIAQKNQKKAPKVKKSAKEAPNVAKLKKTYDMAVLPKPKLIVYIGRF